LKKLAMSYRNPVTGAWTRNLTPDEIVASYSSLIPLLLAPVHLWGFNLVNQYHDSLSANIQDLIITDVTYTAPSLSTLTTHAPQLAALHALRVCAICHHTNICTEERIMNQTISRHLNSKPRTPTITAVYTAPPPYPHPVPAPPAANNMSALTPDHHIGVYTSPSEQMMS
jgi:hypothetical protein